MNPLQDYTYLKLSLFLFAAAAIVLWLSGRHRTFVFVGGCLSITLGLFSFLYIPEYWNPRVTFHFVASPEDVLFSFATGVFASFIPVAFHWRNWRVRASRRRAVARFLGWTVLGLFIALPLRHAWGSANVMYATVVGMAVVAGAILWLREDMVRVGLTAGIAFTLFYGIVLWITDIVFPDFVACWTPSAQLPFATFGLPTFEFVWAFCFGFGWSVLMAHAQDARIVAPGVATSDST